MDSPYSSRDLSALPSLNEAASLLHEMARDQVVRVSRPVDKPLVLYGAGSLGRMAREYLNHVGIPVHLVVDMNARQLSQDAYWAGIPLLRPDEITPDQQQGTLLALCIVTAPYAPMANELASAGWKDIVPFYDIAEHYRDRHPLSNGWFAAPFSKQDEGAIASALECWSDDVSRAHHLQFLAWRRLRQEWSFPDARIDTSNRFFIPEMLAALGQNERFLDAGSYVGQVIKTFLLHTEKQFEHIWAFEPDAGSRAKLQSLLSDMEETRRQEIEILPWAITETEGERPFFSDLGYASQCSDLGGELVPCRAIDTLNLAPTFIKLHLEGMELPALRGAIRTLRQHRPLLTATIYHNDDGLWRTPLWLQNNLPGYALLFRLHSWCGTGATIYALPEERWPASMEATETGLTLAGDPDPCMIAAILRGHDELP